MSSRAKKKAIRRPLPPPADPLAADARRLVRHGITPQDLEKAEKAAYDKGFERGKLFVLKDCYAAAVLAFKDAEQEADAEDCTAFLRKMDDYVTYSLTTEDLMDAALRNAGVTISFREAFSEERIQERA